MKKRLKKIWNKFVHWCCKVGLCNLDKCACDCHGHPKGRSKAFYPTTLKEAKVTVKADTTELKKVVEKHNAPSIEKEKTTSRGNMSFGD
jgi:hypothetical protein